MEKNRTEKYRLTHRLKTLSHMLLLSTAFNVALVLAFLYRSCLQDRVDTSPDKTELIKIVENLHQEELYTNTYEAYKALKPLSFEKLLPFLEKDQALNSEISIRDLALGILVFDHLFNIQEALQEKKLPVKHIIFINADHQTVAKQAYIPHLHYTHYKQIVYFANTEKWPFTSHGLFLKLKNKKNRFDSSLKGLFFQNQDFIRLKLIFERSNLSMSHDQMLDLLLEGNWKQFQNVWHLEKTISKSYLELRRKILENYLANGSKIAAQILVEQDPLYVCQHLSDPLLEKLVSEIDSAKPTYMPFLLEVLASRHNEKIAKKVSACLNDHSTEPSRTTKKSSDNLLLSTHLTTFTPPNSQYNSLKKVPVFHYHVVQPGESLWKIAQKYQTSIDQIIKDNQLSSHLIREGQKLLIQPAKGQGHDHLDAKNHT